MVKTIALPINTKMIETFQGFKMYVPYLTGSHIENKAYIQGDLGGSETSTHWGALWPAVTKERVEYSDDLNIIDDMYLYSQQREGLVYGDKTPLATLLWLRANDANPNRFVTSEINQDIELYVYYRNVQRFNAQRVLAGTEFPDEHERYYLVDPIDRVKWYRMRMFPTDFMQIEGYLTPPCMAEFGDEAKNTYPEYDREDYYFRLDASGDFPGWSNRIRAIRGFTFGIIENQAPYPDNSFEVAKCDSTFYRLYSMAIRYKAPDEEWEWTGLPRDENYYNNQTDDNKYWHENCARAFQLTEDEVRDMYYFTEAQREVGMGNTIGGNPIDFSKYKVIEHMQLNGMQFTMHPMYSFRISLKFIDFFRPSYWKINWWYIGEDIYQAVRGDGTDSEEDLMFRLMLQFSLRHSKLKLFDYCFNINPEFIRNVKLPIPMWLGWLVPIPGSENWTYAIDKLFTTYGEIAMDIIDQLMVVLTVAVGSKFGMKLGKWFYTRYKARKPFNALHKKLDNLQHGLDEMTKKVEPVVLSEMDKQLFYQNYGSALSGVVSNSLDNDMIRQTLSEALTLLNELSTDPTKRTKNNFSLLTDKLSFLFI